jgi:signal transduction histidine kinase
VTSRIHVPALDLTSSSASPEAIAAGRDDRAPRPGVPAPARTLPRWLEALLRVPLAGKIAGANGLVIIGTLLVAVSRSHATAGEQGLILIFGVGSAVCLVVNIALVIVTLRPLRDFHETSRRIGQGNLSARVTPSFAVDIDIGRLGHALNAVVDSLTSDRARMRALASQVINAGDRDRANIARELHDSTAQTLAALMLELSVMALENDDPVERARLERVRGIIGNVLDEVKTLAHTVHPRVLDDLGLVAALRLLARETEERGHVAVRLVAEPLTRTIPAAFTSALYYVAQEAVNNALRHGKPKSIAIRFELAQDAARLEIEDDGTGFDVTSAERRRFGVGLFSMRERASLVGGAVQILSRPGQGTRVLSVVPTLSARGGAATPRDDA